MKVIYSGVLASALVLGAVPAVAQTTTPAPAAPTATLAPAAPTAPIAVSAQAVAPDANVLRAGTPIKLKMAETITTKGKKLQAGYLAHLEVMDDVVVNGVVIIPKGSTAMAEVTDVRNKGMWGKSGKINARLLYVTVGTRQVRLRGLFDDKGVTGTAGVVAAIAFVPIAGFFTTGTSATLPLGAGVDGFVDEDVTLVTAGGADPASLSAGAPAPTPVQTAPASSVAAPAPVVASPAK